MCLSAAACACVCRQRQEDDEEAEEVQPEQAGKSRDKTEVSVGGSVVLCGYHQD